MCLPQQLGKINSTGRLKNSRRIKYYRNCMLFGLKFPSRRYFLGSASAKGKRRGEFSQIKMFKPNFTKKTSRTT